MATFLQEDLVTCLGGAFRAVHRFGSRFHSLPLPDTITSCLQANANVVTLPLFACFNPSPSFYDIFNGYTIGPTALILVMGCIFCGGGALHIARGQQLDDRPFEAFKDRLIKAIILTDRTRMHSLLA